VALSAEKPDVYVQLGRVFSVNSVSFSPDGRSVLTGSDDQTLKLWDVSTGEEIRSFTGHTSLVSSVTFSPDGRYALSGSWDQTLKLWDVETGKEIKTFIGHMNLVSSVSFSLDGRSALSGSWDQTLKLWDIEVGKEIRTFTGHSGPVTSVSFSPDGRTAISGSYDKTAILWHVETGEELRSFSGHAGYVNTIAFSRDGAYAASAGSDKTLKLWDVKTGKEIRTYKGLSNRITSMSFSPDNRYILSGSSDGILMRWDVATGKRAKLTSGRSGWISSVSISPDGMYAVFGGNILKLWDMKSGSEIRTFKEQSTNTKSVAFSASDRYFLSGEANCAFKLWDISTGKELAMLVSFTNGEWIIITPDGFFDSSLNGAKNLNLRIGSSVYSIDQFAPRLYRPDLVHRALSGEELPGGEEEFIQITVNKAAPAVEIVSPKSGVVLDGDSFVLSVKLTENDGGIGNINVYCNGSLVANETKSASTTGEKNPNIRMLTFRVPLISGENTVSVVAFNKDGSMSSKPASITITSKAVVSKPNLHAIIVGINRYGNEFISLKYAASDAASFAETLKNSAVALFGNINITVLTSFEETSKDAIKNAFVKMQNNIKPNDLFVFYIASHGLIDTVDGEERYYLLTSNVFFLSSHQIQKQALSQKEIVDLVGNIPTQNKFILFDTCHAGRGTQSTAGESFRYGRGLTESAAVKLLQRTIGGTFISSSSDIHTAFEGYQERGLFSYVLNEGLKGKAEATKEGFITIETLTEYVQSEMTRLSGSVFKKEQTPILQVGPIFPVAKIK
jgi:WD40 repeat protein